MLFKGARNANETKYCDFEKLNSTLFKSTSNSMDIVIKKNTGDEVRLEYFNRKYTLYFNEKKYTQSMVWISLRITKKIQKY